MLVLPNMPEPMKKILQEKRNEFLEKEKTNKPAIRGNPTPMIEATKKLESGKTNKGMNRLPQKLGMNEENRNNRR